MILGLVKCGQGQEALKLADRMKQEGVDPDRITFVGLLDACADSAALKKSRAFHTKIIESGLEYDALVGRSLINMYAKCGSIENAWNVFDKMPTRYAASWNALIQGHMKSGKVQEAMDLSQQMQQDCMAPDPTSSMGLLNIPGLEHPTIGHAQGLQSELDSDVLIDKSLLPSMGA